MEAVKRKDPALVSQVTELIQSGLSPQAIAEALLEQNRQQAEGFHSNSELFPENILLTSQALAFRTATREDAEKITRIINSAYLAEISGPEAFRTGKTVNEEDICLNITNSLYTWILVEVPCGRDVASDGDILGVCAFTSDGVSRKNGVDEGKVGSIRYLAVLPQYQGALIGHRLLRKVESLMSQPPFNCCRVMMSIPECRLSMINWALNRDYMDGPSVPYPVQETGHTLTQDVPLIIFHRGLQIDSIQNKILNSNDKHLPPVFRKLNPS